MCIGPGVRVTCFRGRYFPTDHLSVVLHRTSLLMKSFVWKLGGVLLAMVGLDLRGRTASVQHERRRGAYKGEGMRVAVDQVGDAWGRASDRARQMMTRATGGDWAAGPSLRHLQIPHRDGRLGG